MTHIARILVVEDEAPIREGLVELLRVHAYAVECASDGASADKLLQRGSYDLVVLDLMIPPPTGLELLAAMRARGDGTAVLVLTARGSEEDIVAGLERGADDYVTKPFGVRELVARIKGLLRRHPHGAPAGGAALTTPQALTTAPRVALGDALFDPAAARVEYGSGQSVPLTAREVALLAYLYAHRERVVPRAELLVHVWGYRDGSIETRTVDVHVQKLRAKLETIPGGTRWITTTRGMGYRLEVS